MKLFLIFLGISISLHSTSQTVKIDNSLKLRAVKIKFVDTYEANHHPMMEVYEHYFEDNMPDTVIEGKKGKNGYYSFSLKNINHPVYATISDIEDNDHLVRFLRYYLIEPGDNISMVVGKDDAKIRRNNFREGDYWIKFSGNNFYKYQWRYDIDSVTSSFSENVSFDSTGNIIRSNRFDSSILVVNRYNEIYSKKIKRTTLDLLTADYFSSVELDRIYWQFRLAEYYFKNAQASANIYKYCQLRIRIIEALATKKTALLSRTFSQLVAEVALMQQLSSSHKLKNDNKIETVVNDLNIKYSGEFRDKVLTFLSLRVGKLYVPDMRVLNKSLSVVRTSYCLEKLNSFNDSNAVGKEAYKFMLLDVNAKKVKLEDFKGKTVFIDFWFTGCFGCSQYYQKVLMGVEDKFKDNQEVVFLTINIDRVRNKWIEAINSKKYTSEFAINLNTDGKGEEDPVIKNYRVFAFPRPLLIDKYGKIFCNDERELRGKGMEGLKKKIYDALAIK